MSSGPFKNVITKMCLEMIYLIYMHKKDLALNNQQWLICHKTQPTNQPTNQSYNPIHTYIYIYIYIYILFVNKMFVDNHF